MSGVGQLAKGEIMPGCPSAPPAMQ